MVGQVCCEELVGIVDDIQTNEEMGGVLLLLFKIRKQLSGRLCLAVSVII